jgi:hypothetical protein
MSDLKAVLATLDEFGSTFAQANEVDQTVLKSAGDGVNAQPSLGYLSGDDRLYVSSRLRKLSSNDLATIFTRQLGAGAGTGRPIEQTFFGQPGGIAALEGTPVMKALDTSSGAALQRQDLEPILQELFVRVFPAWDRFTKEPANGVVHTWNQVTDYGDAAFMSELATVTDDTATYVRQTTNIAILNTRRGVTFKEQLAVPAGGMSWDAQRLEIQMGLTAMAHKLQKTIFQGQASNSGGTASNELGLYDPNGFTGLRSILNTANAVNFQPYLTSNPDLFVDAVGQATVPITNAIGLSPTVIYMRANEAQQLNSQQVSLQRIVDRVEFVPGVQVPGIATPIGILPIVAVPGDSIGTYTATTFDSNTVADVYLLNEGTITLPYLGSPGPTVLEIPPGVSGQLTRLFILWGMFGLAVKSIPASNKLRADTATS